MGIPLVKRIHDQGQMPAPMVRMDRQVSIANQMQFLILAQSKPGTGEVKRRPVQQRQFQRVSIIGNAGVDIRDVKGNMVELSDKHGAFDLG